VETAIASAGFEIGDALGDPNDAVGVERNGVDTKADEKLGEVGMIAGPSPQIPTLRPLV